MILAKIPVWRVAFLRMPGWRVVREAVALVEVGAGEITAEEVELGRADSRWVETDQA